LLQSTCDRRSSRQGSPVRISVKHLVFFAPVRAVRPEPCGRPWSPCGRGNRGAACAPVCSADRSVSRDVLRCGVYRGDGPQLARLIREGFPPVNVTASHLQVFRSIRRRRRPPRTCAGEGNDRIATRNAPARKSIDHTLTRYLTSPPVRRIIMPLRHWLCSGLKS
jgi:hypothetical protein